MKKPRINKLIKDKDKMIMKLKRESAKKTEKFQQTIQQLKNELEKQQRLNHINSEEINSLKSQLEKLKTKNNTKTIKSQKQMSSVKDIEGSSIIDEVEEDAKVDHKASHATEKNSLNKSKSKAEIKPNIEPKSKLKDDLKGIPANKIDSPNSK